MKVTAEVSTVPLITAALALALVGAALELTCGATGIKTLKLVVAAVEVPPSSPYSMR